MKITKIEISIKNILLFLLLVSIFSLSLAYISEYFFGLKPCILCLYQRIPFFVIIFISSIALFALTRPNLQKIAIILCILSLFVNAGVAFYHVGVEQKIFKMTEKCADDLGKAQSLEELKAAIKNTKLAKCNEPQFHLFGLSMAAWNMIFCFFLATSLAFLTYLRQSQIIRR